MKRKTPSRSWARLSGPRDVNALLYEGQLSAVLSVDAIPVRLVWTQDMWDYLLHRLEMGDQIEPLDYPGSQDDLTIAVRRWLSGRHASLVVGSVSPWIEAILFHEGCRNVMTLDIAKIDSEVAELHTFTYEEWAERRIDIDLLVSFSTVEHFGLGRYGDEQDPEADIKWMRQFALGNLSQEGVQLVAVPIAETGLSTDAHRIYGPRRLKRLTRGWQLAETIFQGRVLDHIPFAAEFSGHDWQKQPVLVLRREQQ